MLISTAYAQAAGAGAPGGDMLGLITPMILIFAVMYFLVFRPQQRKAKEHKAMLDALRRGDRIVTNGGIIGTVTKAADDEVVVEIAEGVRVRVVRSMINTVLAKPEPAKTPRADDDKGADKPGDAPPADASANSPIRSLGRLLGRK